MAFVYPGAGALDYYPCRYGQSKLVFRGPRRNIAAAYCAVLGGTETYGKFIPSPYPALVEEKTGRRMINLGCLNAGPDVYLNDAEIMRIASKADVTVVQVFGATNLTNRFYTVHPRRNDRFLHASPWLRTVYRDVDFTEFHFTRHLLQTLYHVSEERFHVVLAELRTAWVTRMRELLRQIRGKTLLLWLADHSPSEVGGKVNLHSDPLLVDAAMIAEVRREASAYLEVVTSQGAKNEGVESKGFSPLERPAAEGVPGPLAHHETADAVAEAIERLL
jgi:hypothetical protein